MLLSQFTLNKLYFDCLANNVFMDSLIPKDLFFKIDFNITYVPFFLCLVESGDEDTGMKYLFRFESRVRETRS